MFYRIPVNEINRIINRYRPTADRMAALGFYAHQQVKDRFSTQGESGGSPWAPKKMKEWGYDDGRSVLTGRSGDLLNAYFSYSEIEGQVGRAVIANSKTYSKIQHLGTIGKGGEMPTIRPVHAKALFIPVTDRGATSERVYHASARIEKINGRWVIGSPKRIATQGSRIPGVSTFTPLIKGRLKNNRLEGLDPKTGKYSASILPDFILLQSVDISPRPQLPTSNLERENQVKFFSQQF